MAQDVVLTKEGYEELSAKLKVLKSEGRSEIAEKLKVARLPSVSVDGIFGPSTTAAVIAFQNLLGIPADGIVGLQTWIQLEQAYQDILRTLPPGIEGNRAKPYPGFFLSEGQQNESVRDLQTYLRGIAEYTGVIPVIPVTGYFGSQTQAAVSALQAQNGLPVNGAVGPVTWNLIRRLYDSR
ncbi:MAG: peptidoglycan-binding protein [Anaerotignum sp.]|nr:peptidoglycan-binding protein [Anaerotignum sp.]